MKLLFQVFERILFIWAIRHPASGYVQGMNDLVTPFFVVFLSEHVQNGKFSFSQTVPASIVINLYSYIIVVKSYNDVERGNASTVGLLWATNKVTMVVNNRYCIFNNLSKLFSFWHDLVLPLSQMLT